MALDNWTPQQAIDEARRVYLNDSAGQRYTDARMFDIFKSSLDIILLKLVESEVPYTKLTTEVGPAVASATSIAVLGSGLPGAPAMVPIRVYEKPVGDTTWTPMIEQDWVPLDLTPGKYRGYWRWGSNSPNTPRSLLLFPAGTTSTTFLVDCRIATPTLAASDDTIYLPGMRSYFAARIAALAATFIGNNPTKGQQCEAIAQSILDSYLNINAKKNQSMPHSRRAFGTWKRSGWRFWGNR